MNYRRDRSLWAALCAAEGALRLVVDASGSSAEIATASRAALAWIERAKHEGVEHAIDTQHDMGTAMGLAADRA